jgi:hypothetical protein
MGIYDRDHRQNDPWKKNNDWLKEKFNFNEAKGEVELNDEEILNPSKKNLHNPKIISNRTYYKSNNREVTEDIHNFNQASDARRKLKEFKQTWKLEKPNNKSLAWFIPWIVGLLIILAVAKEFHKHNRTNPITPVSAQNIEQPIFKPSKALAIPLTSILSTTYDQASATCPFNLIADNKNYYVKVCDTMRGNKTIAKFFIRAGEKLTTKVPSGNYKIKYGSGDEWYGEKELFGQFSQYGESESLNFTFDGYSSQGNTISFYQRVNGNFHTNNIGRDTVTQD